MYNPREEHHVNIESFRGKDVIRKSLATYKQIQRRFEKVLDLNDHSSIDATFAAFKQEGLFEQAKKVRETFFGRDMHFYGVTYLWDHCIERCVYCPAAIQNRAGVYKPREMTIDETIEDIQAVLSDGHTRICVLTGEEPRGHPAQMLGEYLAAIDNLGLEEIILNIDPKTSEDFAVLRQAVHNTPLQFRVFQETYNRELYKEMHPKSKGLKWDYDFRRGSQARALRAGFDNIGIGALFGLNSHPLEEVEGLRAHAEDIKTGFGIIPARVALPSANFMDRIGVHIPHTLSKGDYDADENLIELGPYEKVSMITYASAKLGMPALNIISSERDPKGLLEKLDAFASCTTLNVHPGVGDNAKFHRCEMSDEVHFEQAISFSRDPKATFADMERRGLTPILNLK